MSRCPSRRSSPCSRWTDATAAFHTIRIPRGVRIFYGPPASAAYILYKVWEPPREVAARRSGSWNRRFPAGVSRRAFPGGRFPAGGAVRRGTLCESFRCVPGPGPCALRPGPCACWAGRCCARRHIVGRRGRRGWPGLLRAGHVWAGPARRPCRIRPTPSCRPRPCFSGSGAGCTPTR